MAVTSALDLVGFDADDTLWRSQDYFDAAQLEFEAIVGGYVDLEQGDTQARLYAVESRNIGTFGYGVKGMALSMIEAAVDITSARISATDLRRIVGMAKDMLHHPVELLPGIVEAVHAIAARHRVVLITKGDLFHQERKVAASGLSDVFHRIEVVSEKHPSTYVRVLAECGVAASRFAMVGNSLRSDIAPVLALGGWGVHMPYHVTWVHEAAVEVDADAPRLRTVAAPSELPAAIESIDAGKPFGNAS